MFNIQELIQPFVNAVPGLLKLLALVVVAFVVAKVLRKATIFSLRKLGFASKLVKWNVVKDEVKARSLANTIGQLVYFLVILFFLPLIFSGLNVDSAFSPISTMFSSIFAYLPKVISAGLILYVGGFFCKFIKNIVAGLLGSERIGKLLEKGLGKEATSKQAQIADALSTVVYVLVFLPILTLALETLSIKSISEPVVSLLNQIVAIIPNILVAVLVLVIGGFIVKLVSDLVENLLKSSGLDNYSKYLGGEYTLSKLSAQLLSGVLTVFFVVQAISILGLGVLNNIGVAVIKYLPNAISAILLLVVAIIGGNILSSFIAKVGNQLLGNVVKYGVLVLAVFMALNQLNIATTIVNSAFTIILSAAAVAFALAFGLGGKDFAAKQLEKLNNFISKK
ncbi:MAG: mechanosensitive ion channel [Gemella sp.]|nr:mechanosensitive ion channel [Gemella sp.]